MTLYEYNKAKEILTGEQRAKLDNIVPGKWVAVNEDSVQGVYNSKTEATQDLLTRHCQSKKNSIGHRHKPGIYALHILDCDEPPSEKSYHTYLLEKISKTNAFRYKELLITAMLPD